MSKKKTKSLEELFPDPEIRDRVKEQLYSGNSLFGEGSVFSEMLQSMINAALEAEMDEFMSEQKANPTKKKNRRNGHLSKTVRSSTGPLSISTPRDRNGDHEPILVGKRERELKTGMDEIILELYASGNSVSDIRRQILRIYGVELSQGLISSITDKVLDEVTRWQQRPLAPCYTIIYLDGVHYRTREDGMSSGRVIYSIYGVDVDGNRDILGLYVFNEEGARNWGLILEDLKKRGVEQVFFFCIDGLKGLKNVIHEVYPKAIVQRCIVHMIRRSTRFVSYNDRKKVCKDLREIYTAVNHQSAEQALIAFKNKWDKVYPEISKNWEEIWDDLVAFLEYGTHIRRMIYTTNPVEAVHRIMRKVTKTKGTWPNDRALLKQLYLTLRNNNQSWKRKAFNWSAIQRELLDKFGDEYSRYLTE